MSPALLPIASYIPSFLPAVPHFPFCFFLLLCCVVVHHHVMVVGGWLVMMMAAASAAKQHSAFLLAKLRGGVKRAPWWCGSSWVLLLREVWCFEGKEGGGEAVLKHHQSPCHISSIRREQHAL